jgi:hypothetical protein
MRALSIMLSYCLALGVARAENAQTLDGIWEVHTSAFRSDFLTAEVATQYGIARSGKRAVVNIAVLRIDGAGPVAAQARIEARVRNLVGQTQNLDLRAVREGDALYYLGEFAIAGTDTYRVELTLRPEGATRDYRVVFNQNLEAAR